MANRNLKVLLSVGGWTYSQAGTHSDRLLVASAQADTIFKGHFSFVTSPSSRATFVSNAVNIMETYGFDGIDIDFEYPSNAAQGQGLADLVTELRRAFTNLASTKGDSTPYLVTAAVSAGPANYAYLNIPQMDASLSYWNLMVRLLLPLELSVAKAGR